MDIKSQSRLLQLPDELILMILEFAIVEDEPLLLNCGCDSSYDSEEDWEEDETLWQDGEKHPPDQPAISRTCAVLRSVALRMFYRENAFRAHYCYAVDVGMAISWLRCIGPENRSLLRDICFWDKNSQYDAQSPRELVQLKRSEVPRDMGGRFENVSTEKLTCHRVIFEDRDDNAHYELVPLLFRGGEV